MEFTSRYGYVGLAVEQKEFVAEGLNEAGLSAGLFYFPGYGKYEEYEPHTKSVEHSRFTIGIMAVGKLFYCGRGKGGY